MRFISAIAAVVFVGVTMFLQHQVTEFRAAAVAPPRSFGFNNELNYMLEGAPSWPIDLVCPVKMQIGSSYAVRLSLPPTTGHPVLTEPGTIALRGGGFAIEPREVLSWIASEALPIGKLWTVTAKTAGEHVLLFDLSGSKLHTLELRDPMVDVFDMESVSRGKDIPKYAFLDRESRTIAVRINVVNLYGLSPSTVQWLQGFVGLAAFVLAYPLAQQGFVALARRRAARKKRTIIIPGQ